MAVKNGMFVFEVVVEKVTSYVESRNLVIKSDFANIFSLELRDPKQMYIEMPEPPPLPPEPPGKKGKKKKPPAKKGKKGKGKVEAPPPEPIIQSGQSVLFTSSAELLIQNMKKSPMEVSLWSKEDNLVFIGSATIPWDPVFLIFLQKICDCEEPPPVTLNDEYNIFQERTAKLMAKIGLQVKLSYLTEKVTTCFRTLSEDPALRKVLYTGFNNKLTSYMCTLKTTDETFNENCNKIENSFIKDRPEPKPILYADYKNVPGANVTSFKDDSYCCMAHADKPPDNKYRSPETCPDIDFIADYIRKTIISCNDNMRMLTPRPTIRPKIKATDIDRLCYCKEKDWPEGPLADRFKKAALGDPCPVCIQARGLGVSKSAPFDIANIRGPCGRPDCRIARDMRAYIEKQVIEDNEIFDINEVIGPCGSKSCTLAENIKKIIRHEGEFQHGTTVEGLSTQCACLKQMQNALTEKQDCDSECTNDCDGSSSTATPCGGKGCPSSKLLRQTKVYNVYYFTVEHDLDMKNSADNKSDGKSSRANSSPSGTATNTTTKPSSGAVSSASSDDHDEKYKSCAKTCPELRASQAVCSKSVCSYLPSHRIGNKGSGSSGGGKESKCANPVCPDALARSRSPPDSDIYIRLADIHNPCCVESCDVAERVKDFIVEGAMKNRNVPELAREDDPCYCDCVCTFKFGSKTTYCAVCGGYECMGDDVRYLPEFQKPHPCPVYHKLYDKKYIQVVSPFPEEETKMQASDAVSVKSGKSVMKSLKTGTESRHSMEVIQQKSKVKKKVGKYTVNKTTPPPQEKKKVDGRRSYEIIPVPKHMGWLWTAEDIPGMKPRPKWKPGAANKILVRRYRTIREGIDNIAKKKRALMNRKKKIEMKPTLVVKKTDGEITVQMELFRKYSQGRLLYQYPYDEKPPLIYTIGKTPEEKMKILKQRERRERRENRRKCRLLQSTFRDRCQEICVKAYDQAMGVLPLPNPNNPECPCQTKMTESVSTPLDSCSCSDSGTISTSDTDNDDWIIEFTPPVARWDPKAKHIPVLVDNECQYNYLDFKVKLFDKQGNALPRFFKGPDGKQECSDLGGFWGPNHVWLEINKDGYIGVDNRWVPLNFIGPDGMFYSTEEGNFTDSSGKTWKIGVDGYIDKDGKWAWYSRRSKSFTSANEGAGKSFKTPGKTERKITQTKPTSKAVAQVHSPVKLKVATQVSAAQMKRGMEKDKAQKNVAVSKAKAPRSITVMNVAMKFDRRPYSPNFQGDHMQVDSTKTVKYRDIMQDLKMYDDLCEMKALKSNRATNTFTKSSPFRMSGQYRSTLDEPDKKLPQSPSTSPLASQSIISRKRYYD